MAKITEHQGDPYISLLPFNNILSSSILKKDIRLTINLTQGRQTISNQTKDNSLDFDRIPEVVLPCWQYLCSVQQKPRYKKIAHLFIQWLKYWTNNVELWFIKFQKIAPSMLLLIVIIFGYKLFTLLRSDESRLISSITESNLQPVKYRHSTLYRRYIEIMMLFS